MGAFKYLIFFIINLWIIHKKLLVCDQNLSFNSLGLTTLILQILKLKLMNCEVKINGLWN